LIDWRKDGDVAFDIGGKEIVWQSPTAGQLRKAKNGLGEMADALQALVAEQDAEKIDIEARNAGLLELAIVWVRATHLDVGKGNLPKNVDDWPHWLTMLHGFRFAQKVLEHWGTHPFALKTTTEEQTETAP